MSERFDPYHKWLAIPPEDQPPDHYRLLGLKQFESDAEVIDYAAEQRTRHVRAFQAGKHSDVSQRILNEIAAARVCLLNPEKKKSYDESLRRRPGADTSPAARASAASPVSPAVARVLPPVVAEFPVGARVRSRRTGRNKTAIVGAAAASILIVAAFGLWLGLAGSSDKPAASGPAAGQPPGTPDAEASKPVPLAAASGSPTTMPPAAELPSQPATSVQPSGAQPLEPPQTATAPESTPPAQPPAPAEPPEPTGRILVDGRHAAWVGAEPGNNVYVFETAEPVRLERTGIRFHATSGASQGRLERSFDGETWVPFGRWTPETCAQAQQQFGAWQFAPFSEPSEVTRIHVRFIWEGHQGMTVHRALWVADAGPADGAMVTAVANPGGGESGAPAVGPPEMRPGVAQDAPAAGGQSAPAEGTPSANPPQLRSPPQRHPLPNAQVQEEIRRQMDEVYKPAAKKTPAEKLKLARDFLLQGQKADGKLEERFVFLHSAMELACEAHDAALAIAAVESVGTNFEIDTLDAKVKVLAKAGRGADDEVSLQSLAAVSQHVVEEALAADQIDAASVVAELLSRACQHPAGRPSRKVAQVCRQKVQTARKYGEGFQRATAVLEKEPNNAEALLAVGLWHWVAKDDWDQAAGFLARGSDTELKTLAARELNARPSQPEQQVQLGDAWWTLAEAREGDERDAILRRAGMWYRQAVGGLTGLSKARVEKRLETVPAAETVASGAKAEPKAAPKNSAKKIPPPAGDLGRAAGTVIPDRIEAETRLDKAHGPYKLLGLTTVASGGTLLFERGAFVLCAPGAKIVVEGNLASYGDAEEFVAFRGGVAGRPWSGIVVPNYHRRIVLERFDVRGANCGADLGRGDLLVKDCIFAHNRVGIKLQSEHNQKLENCLIADNLADGLCLWLWRMSIDRCTISNNGGAGLFLEYEGWPKVTNSVIAGNAVGIKSKQYETKPEIHSSNIVGNRLTVEIHTKEDFQCENNYWGTDNPQQILAGFADGRQKPGRGVVRFEPFEPKLIAGAGCSLEPPRER